MTIIQNLINKNYSTNQNFNNVISQGINLPEVDLYLTLLDQKALLIENGDLSQKDIQMQLALDEQAKRLLSVLKQKLIHIAGSSRVTSEELATLAHKLTLALSNDIDMNAIDEQSNSHKVYLVSKILLDVTKGASQQQSLTI